MFFILQNAKFVVTLKNNNTSYPNTVAPAAKRALDIADLFSEKASFKTAMNVKTPNPTIMQNNANENPKPGTSSTPF